jgi:hypothetical protein
LNGVVTNRMGRYCQVSAKPLLDVLECHPATLAIILTVQPFKLAIYNEDYSLLIISGVKTTDSELVIINTEWDRVAAFVNLS